MSLPFPGSVDNFYPRSPCGERRQAQSLKVAAHGISIHALLAESDGQAQSLKVAAHGISIHALLAESDISGLRQRCASFYFYPRSPCGERHRAPPYNLMIHQISIHALLAESDNLRVVDGSRSSIISIHALLAESDLCLMLWPFQHI